MTRARLCIAFALATAALSACTGEKAARNAAGNGMNAAAAAANDTADAVQTVNAASPANTAAPAPDAFTRYVGKYPFDKVGAHSWNDDPAVVAAVESAVDDKAVRKWVLDDAGPASPIATVDGKVASWSCQTHNCGPHQWVTLVDPASGTAEICYFDEAADAQSARWFKAGKEEKRPGQCPEVSS